MFPTALTYGSKTVSNDFWRRIMKWSSTARRSSFCVVLLLMLAITEVKAQVFVPTGHMTQARRGHSATLLQDGRVLIAGGCDVSCRDGSSSAEIYDPASETFTE